MTHPHNKAPVNPLPPVVVALFLMISGIELVLWLGGQGIVGGANAVGWRNSIIETYAFSGQTFDWMLETGRWPPEHLIRFLGYVFLHGSFTQALFGAVILLAIGKVVAEGMGSLAVIVIFVLSSILGALAFGLLSDDPWLVGSFPPVYGLIGGYTFLLWVRLGQKGLPQIRAFALIGFLLAIQLVFGVLFGVTDMWIADVTGFVTGFALSILLNPGGLSRIMARLRSR